MTAEQATLRAQRIIDRCRELATYTDVAGETTRPFLCASARAVQARVRGWMEEAGLEVRLDGVGNMRGVPFTHTLRTPRLLIGSHLDTVPNAGAFDGILGVVLAIEAVAALGEDTLCSPPEIIAFSDEEGVRFNRPFLGSLAVVGRASETSTWADRDGITVEQAIAAFGLDATADTELAPEVSGYLEVHIEQGPVLESLGQSLAVVDAIAGQSRHTLQFYGQSNHAGTTPMALRQDALAAAAEWMVAVEAHARQRPGLVATIGRIEAHPGASNVIPGHVIATLDVRHGDDAVRLNTTHQLLEVAQHSADNRRVTVAVRDDLDQAAVPMDPKLTGQLRRAAMEATGDMPVTLTSGAGHDAMILAGGVPAAMLFVRSPGGLSHHPGEAVLPGDVAAALATVVRLLRKVGTAAGAPATTEWTHA